MEGFAKRINLEMIKKITPDDMRDFLTCGPKFMMVILNKMCLPETQIEFEYFSEYLGVSTREAIQW